MDENHAREQYFFDDETLDALVAFLAGFERPCLVCAPMLARRLHEAGRDVPLLDVDERFGDLPGFRYFDLTRPEPLNTDFDLILCDPPFFTVSLRELFVALRMLHRFDLQRPVMVSYLVRREQAVLRALSGFGVHPTDWEPGYATVTPGEKNRIRFYSNLQSQRASSA